jgi:hypothetical protein
MSDRITVSPTFNPDTTSMLFTELFPSLTCTRFAALPSAVTGESSGETVPIHEGHYRSAVVRTELSAPQSTVREEIRSPNRLRVPVTK